MRTILIFCILLFPISLTFGQPSGKFISGAALIEDVDILRRSMYHHHPGLFRYKTKADVNQLFDQLSDRVSAGLTEAQFLKLLGQFTNQIRCGHTYPNPWNMRKEIRERLFGGQIFFPFTTRIIDKKLYLNQNLSGQEDLIRGTEVLSINDIPVPTILDSLLTITKGDGENTLNNRYNALQVNGVGMRDHQPFDMYFPIFFPFSDGQFQLKVKKYGAEETAEVTVKALTRSDRLARKVQRYGEDPIGQENWQFKFLNDQTAYLLLNNFAIWNWNFDHEPFFDSIFTELGNRRTPNLIVDIRGNSGGLASVPNYLLRYLIEEPLEVPGTIRRLIRNYQPDTTLLPYLETYEEDLKKGLPEEAVRPVEDDLYEILISEERTQLLPMKNRYEGQVFFIANASNASATFGLLRSVQLEEIGTVVGQPTGGNQQGINGSNYFFCYLPNSQMEIDIPLIFQKPTAPQPDQGILPDWYVKPNPDDFANGTDTELEAVIEKINK